MGCSHSIRAERSSAAEERAEGRVRGQRAGGRGQRAGGCAEGRGQGDVRGHRRLCLPSQVLGEDFPQGGSELLLILL